MSSLKTAIGRPIEELAADDPNRLQFGLLHQYSVYVLMAAMISAALSYFLLSYRTRNTADREIIKTDTELKDFTDFKI